VVHEDVKVIRQGAFSNCHHLKTVTMFDNVETIENYAFPTCLKLKYIKLSKGLKTIGEFAFSNCCAVRSYSIPSSITTIESKSFMDNRKLRFIRLPRHLENVLPDLTKTAICSETARRANAELYRRVNLMEREHGTWGGNRMYRSYWPSHEIMARNPTIYEDIVRMNEWVCFHMETYTFHNMCFDPLVTLEVMSEYLRNNGNGIVREVEPYNNTNPLHMLAMNPHAPESAFAFLYELWKEGALQKDYHWTNPIEYARLHNVRGMLTMVRCLCLHRCATVVPVPIKPKPWDNRLRKRSRITYY
jgi:hypothetical protein